MFTDVQVARQILQQLLLWTVRMMTGTCPRRKEVGLYQQTCTLCFCRPTLHVSILCQALHLSLSKEHALSLYQSLPNSSKLR